MTDDLLEPRDPRLTVVNPTELGAPRGFSHGVLTTAGGRRLFVAGQTAANHEGDVAADAFTNQFELALTRVLTVVRAAGGVPRHIVRMTIYVTDIATYRACRRQLRDVWRRHMDDHYPAIALVQVVALVDEHALVEIEAEAVLP
jgi:enamine deaminase RidA (YjgF/YER057c/UK114 family)